MLNHASFDICAFEICEIKLATLYVISAMLSRRLLTNQMHRCRISYVEYEDEERKEVIELQSSEADGVNADRKTEENDGASETEEGPNLVEELRDQRCQFF